MEITFLGTGPAWGLPELGCHCLACDTLRRRREERTRTCMLLRGQETLPRGGAQGRNAFGRVGYGGPCPPPGHPHRYYFKLYALDARVNLPPGASKAELLKAMEGRIKAEAQLMATFGR